MAEIILSIMQKLRAKAKAACHQAVQDFEKTVA